MAEKLEQIWTKNSQLFENFKECSDGFDDWKKLLMSSENYSAYFLQVTKKIPAEKIKSYFELNGFFFNQKDFQVFKEEFPIEAEMKTSNEKWWETAKMITKIFEKTNIDFTQLDAKDKQSIELLLSLSKDISQEFEKSWDLHKVKEFFDKLNDPNFLSDKAFNALMSSIRKSDEKLYQDFKVAHITSSEWNDDIKRRYVLFESEYTLTPIQLDSKNPDPKIQAVMWDETWNIEHHGNLIEKTVWDKVIQYDLGTNISYMKLKDSEYSLRRRLPERVLKETGFRETEAKFQGEVNTISISQKSFENFFQNSELGEDIRWGEDKILNRDIVDFSKNYIATNLKFWEDSFKREILNQVKEWMTLWALRKIIKQILEKWDLVKSQLKFEFEWKLQEQVKKYKEKLKDEDEKQHKILQFLHQIGFDLLPKSLTDAVIMRLQWWSHLRPTVNIPWLTFTTEINIAEGHFWISEGNDGNISEVEKVFFVKFFNKMLTWGVDDPVKLRGNDLATGSREEIQKVTRDLKNGMTLTPKMLYNNLIKQPNKTP